VGGDWWGMIDGLEIIAVANVCGHCGGLQIRGLQAFGGRRTTDLQEVLGALLFIMMLKSDL
jgi:hypothetical protein